ncbi:hypothetical protein OH807_03480 [Kitasatospora sp. NBC_01560]|uniref:hypothetical protein n=1 Tax=Kitasatospora sp. NBC_01560 TaxID=2975965 RepID=UPI00386E188E
MSVSSVLSPNTTSTPKPSKSVRSVKFAARAACSVLLLAAPLLLAQPATANNGPKTPEESAACRGVLNTLIGGSLFGAGGVGAVCAVQPSTEAGQSTSAGQSLSSGPSTRGAVRADLPKMRQEVADLRSRAATLDALGEHEAAQRTRARADALQRRIDAIVRAEENN